MAEFLKLVVCSLSNISYRLDFIICTYKVKRVDTPSKPMIDIIE